LGQLQLHADEVEDIYFTGGLNDPDKTDFFVEYRDAQGKTRHYTPDFMVRRKDGRCLIVEIKAERERNHPVDGQKGFKALAVQDWVGLNPDRLKYEMIFTAGDSVAFNQLRPTITFLTD